MSIATRIEAIEQHLTDDYSVLTLAGADLTNVDKNIINLKPTWKERLLYFMNNGIDVVWDNWEKVIGEGTELTLSNTEQAPMKVLLKGNTYQDSTTGKSLTYIEDRAGITSQTTLKTITLSAGTYTFQATLKNNANISTFVAITSAGVVLKKGSIINGNSIGISTATVTLDEEKTVLLAIGGSASGYNVNASKCMLEAGSQATSYEPYTGENPAPSPDYPMSVHVVSGDNEVEVFGRNLLDDTTIKRTVPSSGSISVVINRTIRAGTYRFGCFVDGQFVSTSNIYSFLFRNGNTNIVGSGNPNSAITITQEQAEQVDNVLAYFNSTFTDTYKGKEITGYMLVSGSTLGNYEPYTGTTYPINLPEGMFLGSIGDYKDRFFKTSGKNLFSSEMELGSLDNSTGATTSGSNSIRTKDYIEVKPNTTYTLSNNKNYHIYVYEYNNNKTFIQYKGDNVPAYAGKVSFTTTSTTEYIKVRTVASNVENDLSSLWQLEKGNISTPVYEPYGSNEWYLEKKIGKVVLNGTETWYLWNSTNVNTQRFYIRNTIANMHAFESANTSINNRFYFENSNDDKEHYKGSVTNNTAEFVVFINRSRLGTVDTTGMKNWVASNNINLYFALTTTTYTKIEGTLASQLESVYRAKSEEGQTNISQTNNDLPFVLSVSALKEI